VADQLAALGIGAPTDEARREQVRSILKEAQPYSQRQDGMTLRWRDASGAELWIYVDSDGTMRSVQPHMSGGPRMTLEIQAVLDRPDISPFDGGFLGLTQSGGSNPALGGGFAVVFDAPDFPDVRDASLTAKHDVELAGFALELNTYGTEEEFREDQPELEPLGIPAFVPAGMMSQMEGEAATAHALMVGRLVKGRKVTNEITKQSFLRLEVETPAGPLGLAVAPETLQEVPEEGTILQVGAWLSGRLAPEDDEK
jgi:hypothetical protein